MNIMLWTIGHNCIGMYCFPKKYVRAGVRTGETSVVEVVRATENATSAAARYDITPAAMASGTAAARMSPTANAGSRLKNLMIQNARSGIMRNCAVVPIRTSFGFSNIGTKSLVESRQPIPNMVKANSQSIKGFNGTSTCGKTNPMAAARTTHTTSIFENFSNSLFHTPNSLLSTPNYCFFLC